MTRIPPITASSETGPPIPALIGSGAAMEKVYRLTRQVARSNASVLLLGETGTGKELIAKAIHTLSPRGSGPFVRVNCGALAENLLESELFGHVRGSFTGAVDNRTGRFEAAHTGTVFLDEINSTTAKLQVKLLRVLQEHEFERVGDTHTIRVDTRVIAASNRELLDETEAGRFREDLYYRLNVISIELPPLRDRREDVPALVSHFLQIYNEQNDRHVPHIERAAMDALQQYDWPGNVRELQNYVERAVVLAPGDEITYDLLPEVVRGERPRRIGRRPGVDLETLAAEMAAEGIAAAGTRAENLHRQVVDRVERELIAQVMAECDNVQVKAAARLGINRNTLHKKLKQYDLEQVEVDQTAEQESSMQLDCYKLEMDVRAYLRSPASAKVWEEFENSVLFNIFGTLIFTVIGLVLICTIVYAKLGFALVRAMILSIFNLEVFRNQRKVLQKHPERITPLVVASMIVGPSGHGLVLGTLSKETQTDLDLLGRKASELADFYLEGADSHEDQEVVSMLRDDTYVLNRRRRVPDSHSEGHDLLLFDLEIDRGEVCLSADDCCWMLCLVTTDRQLSDGQPRGNIFQIPWNVAAQAVTA